MNTENLIQDIVFKKLLKETGIEPAEIEVVDPIIVTPKSKVERFYEWLQMCKNQYIGDDTQVTNAFNIVYNHS